MACKKRKGLTKEDIDSIIEVTLSGAIGSFPKPMGTVSRDPAFGGRTKLTNDQLKFAVRSLLGDEPMPTEI